MSKAFKYSDQAQKLLYSTLELEASQEIKFTQLLEEAAQAAQNCREWLQIGYAYLEAAQPARALESLKKAQALDPKNPASYLFLSLAAADEGDYQTAQSYLEELLKLSPENQAAPSVQVLFYLLQEEIEPALKLLFPSKGRFDLTVSPQVLNRLAAALERKLCALELPPAPEEPPVPPEAPALSEETPPPEESSALESAPNSPEVSSMTPETAVPAPSEEEPTPTEEPNQTKEPNPTEDPSQTEAPAPKEETPKVGVWAKAEASNKAGRGSRKLQRAWGLEGERRLEIIAAARRELEEAYALYPDLSMLSYDLGEACLGGVEYAHRPGQPYTEAERLEIEGAQKYFLQALGENKENAYTLHYLGRCSLLLGAYSQAIDYWERALRFFEKLPEAHYGLAQAHLMLGRDFLARRYLDLALNSDLQLLRGRFQDLREWQEGRASA